MDAPATFLAGADVEAAAEGRSSFEHAAETKPGVDTRGVDVAIVGDVDVELVVAFARTLTCALDASAWRSTLVSASWTIRKVAPPIADGMAAPSTSTSMSAMQPGGTCLFHESGE